MKKQDIVNLIRYHTEKNEAAFVAEAVNVAYDFSNNGDDALAEYIMELVSDSNVYIPQRSYTNLRFLKNTPYSMKPLYLPNAIEEDVFGIINAINRHSGVSKFLFHGAPGTGKTETANQIARLLNRTLLSVNFEQLIDSRLGETAKNVLSLFDEINRLASESVVVFFDEIDAFVLDRVNNHDVREMGRVTSTFLRQLDNVNKNVVVIAATNLVGNFDKALLRRFDSVISFDRYSKDDLLAVAGAILESALKKADNSKKNMRLFNKILSNVEKLPEPGDLKQIVNTAVAFGDSSDAYDYLRRIFISLYGRELANDIGYLKKAGYTTRETEILSKVSKSSVGRKLKTGAVHE